MLSEAKHLSTVARAEDRHSERSEAQSSRNAARQGEAGLLNPDALPVRNTTGSFDCARNDDVSLTMLHE
jgi:hypothetical protein